MKKQAKRKEVKRMEALFKKYPCFDPYDYETTALDLISDLRHMAKHYLWDFDSLIERSLNHFEAEVLGLE